MRNLHECALCGRHFPESEPLVACPLCQSLEAGQVEKRDWPQCISCGKIYKYLRKETCEAITCRSIPSATMTAESLDMSHQPQSDATVSDNARTQPMPAAASDTESSSESDPWSEGVMIDDEIVRPPPLPLQPQTPTKSRSADIFISIRHDKMADIVSQRQNHEFRCFRFPSQRVWIYETQPVEALQYCAIVGIAKKPGEISVSDLECKHNKWFNDIALEPPGKYRPEFAHKIFKLYRVKAVSLAELKQRGWAQCSPQKYHWAKQEMVDEMRKDWVEIF